MQLRISRKYGTLQSGFTETAMQLQAEADLNGSAELDDLDRAVLWAMRSVAVGRGDCPSLRRTFHDLYGPAADQILCGLLVLVRLLSARASQGLRLHMPGSSAISGDELRILAALAAVQEEGLAAGRVAVNRGLAQLLGGRPDAGLAAAIRYVAKLLSDGGRRLTAGRLATCERGGSEPGRTLH